MKSHVAYRYFRLNTVKLYMEKYLSQNGEQDLSWVMGASSGLLVDSALSDCITGQSFAGGGEG